MRTAYIAVVEGAAGILWFTAEARSNVTSQYITLQQELPQLWTMFSRIALEIRQLTPTILGEAAGPQPTVHCNASLHARAWVRGGVVAIVAVNAGPSALAARCELRGVSLPTNLSAEVLGEVSAPALLARCGWLG